MTLNTITAAVPTEVFRGPYDVSGGTIHVTFNLSERNELVCSISRESDDPSPSRLLAVRCRDFGNNEAMKREFEYLRDQYSPSSFCKHHVNIKMESFLEEVYGIESGNLFERSAADIPDVPTWYILDKMFYYSDDRINEARLLTLIKSDFSHDAGVAKKELQDLFDVIDSKETEIKDIANQIAQLRVKIGDKRVDIKRNFNID